MELLDKLQVDAKEPTVEKIIDDLVNPPSPLVPPVSPVSPVSPSSITVSSTDKHKKVMQDYYQKRKQH